MKREVDTRARSEFDEIAEKYDQEMPGHIREHLCAKKAYFMIRQLKMHKQASGPNAAIGLDCGCGTGWHVKALREGGYIVNGIDASEKMVKEARKNNAGNNARFSVSSVDRLAFRDKSYDFMYFINVLHHLSGLDIQQNALTEAHRVLKPGGLAFISEVNEDSLLFRLYMKLIFPLTNKIHGRGRQEIYWKIDDILTFAKEDWSLVGIEYFTFLPNIIPAFAFPFFKRAEAFLERRAGYKFGAHWLMTLKKRG